MSSWPCDGVFRVASVIPSYCSVFTEFVFWITRIWYSCRIHTIIVFLLHTHTLIRFSWQVIDIMLLIARADSPAFMTLFFGLLCLEHAAGKTRRPPKSSCPPYRQWRKTRYKSRLKQARTLLVPMQLPRMPTPQQALPSLLLLVFFQTTRATKTQVGLFASHFFLLLFLSWPIVASLVRPLCYLALSFVLPP